MSVLTHVDFDYYEYLSLQSSAMVVLLLCNMRLHRMFDEMQNEGSDLVYDIEVAYPMP